MQRLRTHIAKLFVISLIWFGFGFYIVQPAQAKSSARSFAYWFSHVAQQTDASEVTRELNRLKDSGVELNELIEQASEIISKNNEGFNLPLKGVSGSHQIYQILLAQWSSFQTGSGMANVPPPETVKSGINLHVDKFSSLGHGKTAGVVPLVFAKSEAAPAYDCACFARSVTPMATGIAIGAP